MLNLRDPVSKCGEVHYWENKKSNNWPGDLPGNGGLTTGPIASSGCGMVFASTGDWRTQFDFLSSRCSRGDRQTESALDSMMLGLAGARRFICICLPSTRLLSCFVQGFDVKVHSFHSICFTPRPRSSSYPRDCTEHAQSFR